MNVNERARGREKKEGEKYWSEGGKEEEGNEAKERKRGLRMVREKESSKEIG
jgi:hypothetical protein